MTVRLLESLVTRRHSKTLAVVIGLAACNAAGNAVPSHAQSARTEGSTLEIRTDLPWSRISLEGSAEVRGVSPLRVPGPLTGDFWLVAGGRGVETQRGRVSIRLDEEGSRIVSHGAIPFRQSFFRGLLFPGYSQFRSGSEGRGALMSTAALGALFAAGREQREVWDQADDREAAQRDFDATSDAALRPFALAALNEAREEENVARDRRNLFLMATGAILGISLIDATFFSPGFQVSSADESSLSLAMKPRSRSRALLRSIVFPGLGQEYDGQSVKAAFVASGAILAGTLFLHEQADLKQAQSEVKQAEVKLASLPNGPERDDVEADLDRFEDEADGASTDRSLAMGLLVAYWGASLLDTALSFDEPWGSHQVGEGWRFGLNGDSERTFLVASRRF